MRLKFKIYAVLLVGAVVAFSGDAEAAGCATPQNAGAMKAQVGALVNAQRTAKGRSALTENAALAAAAQAHACDMARRAVLSHTGADGSEVQTRVQRQGYNWRLAAENIAYGTSLGSVGVVELWMNSSGHKRNILLRKAQVFGVGVARSGNLNYWVMVFAQPR